MKFIYQDNLYDTEKSTLVWTEYVDNKRYAIFGNIKGIKEKSVYDSKTEFYVTKNREWFSVSDNRFSSIPSTTAKLILEKYPEIYIKYFKVTKK